MTRTEAARLLAAVPAPRRVVLANGLFDLFHVGHRRYLEAARALGDRLVVAVNDDGSSRRLKGPGRPLVPAPERALIVAGLRAVDLVVLFPEDDAARTIRLLRPALHAKGTDYGPGTVPAAEREALEAVGGRAVFVGDPKRHATRDLIDEVLRRYGSGTEASS